MFSREKSSLKQPPGAPRERAVGRGKTRGQTLFPSALFVVSPHANNLDGLLFGINLVDEAVLNADPS